MWNDRDGRMLRSPHGDCGNDNNNIGIHILLRLVVSIWLRAGIAWISRQQGRITNDRPKPCIFVRWRIKKDPLNEKMSVIFIFTFFVLWKITFQVSSINEITASVSNFIYWPRNILSYKKISLSLKHSYLYTTYVCICRVYTIKDMLWYFFYFSHRRYNTMHIHSVYKILELDVPKSYR